MPAAVARAGPLPVGLPNALKVGFLGRPTGADLSSVGAAEGSGVDGFAGSLEAAMGTPSLAAAEVEAVADERVFELDAAGTGGGVAADGKSKSQQQDTQQMWKYCPPLAASAAFLAFQASRRSLFSRNFSSSAVSAFAGPATPFGAGLADPLGALSITGDAVTESALSLAVDGVAFAMEAGEAVRRLADEDSGERGRGSLSRRSRWSLSSLLLSPLSLSLSLSRSLSLSFSLRESRSLSLRLSLLLDRRDEVE